MLSFAQVTEFVSTASFSQNFFSNIFSNRFIFSCFSIVFFVRLSFHLHFHFFNQQDFLVLLKCSEESFLCAVYFCALQFIIWSWSSIVNFSVFHFSCCFQSRKSIVIGWCSHFYLTQVHKAHEQCALAHAFHGMSENERVKERSRASTSVWRAFWRLYFGLLKSFTEPWYAISHRRFVYAADFTIVLLWKTKIWKCWM